MRVEQIGDCTLYLGDCMDILPTLEKVDAVVTDPPYGINAGHGIGRSDRLRIAASGKKEWDTSAPDISNLLELGDCIIWGGNYFGLPPSRGFLIWDKNNSGRDFADCEMAWCSMDMNARIYQMRPMNMDGGKEHPTQKPVDLMRWCLSFLPNAETILDPFMGSGTTLVACAKMGRKGIGIELDPDYFEIACRRVEQAYAQPDLFIEPPPKQVQHEIEL